MSRAARLAVDRGTLAALRAAETAEISEFPVGADRTVTVDLRRARPFTPDAVVEEVSATGARRIPIRPPAYFTGSIRGEPGSRVLLVAGQSHAQGLVVSDGEIYPFGRDGAGGHRAYALRDVDTTLHPPPKQFCGNDLHRDVVEAPARAAQALREMGFAPSPMVPVAADTLLTAQVAIVTDYELYAKYGTSTGVTDYIGELVLAANMIYETDVALTLSVPKVRVYTSSADPWTQSDTAAALYELVDEWSDSTSGLAAFFGAGVDLVHLVSGKTVSGGIAFLPGVCEEQYFFGVSQVYAASSPNDAWDKIVFTHEIGHNVGSPHTHCYSPPLDQCYNAEPGCYSGQMVITRGTIMSYCHLYAGTDNIDLEFGTTVSDRIRGVIEAASCLTADGGGGGGGGGDGGGGGGGGSANCGDGSLHPGETCDDGNKNDGDGCSASCQVEPGCGDGAVTPDEECDDGNTVSGDGCSARCLKEPCTVKYQPQKVWEAARLEMLQGKRLSFRAQFGTATDVSAAAVNANGVHLVVTGIDGTPVIDAMLPPGRWSVKGRRATFRDGGSLYGIRKVTVRDRTRHDAPRVQVVVSGKGGVPAVDESLLPLVVTVVLGDQAAGDAGACGRHAFAAGTCDALQHGRRILCR